MIAAIYGAGRKDDQFGSDSNCYPFFAVAGTPMAQTLW